MFLGAADATAAAATTTAALGLAQEAREVRRRRAEGPVRGYTSNADPKDREWRRWRVRTATRAASPIDDGSWDGNVTLNCMVTMIVGCDRR